jgi:hypothetical protein
MLMTEVKTGDATAVAAVPPRWFLSALVWIKADGGGNRRHPESDRDPGPRRLGNPLARAPYARRVFLYPRR